MAANSELAVRYETARYILDRSYSQLERYDAKTNQLLSLIGLDFTVLGIFTSFIYDSNLSLIIKTTFILAVLLDWVLIIMSLFSLKKTLSPHLKPVDNKPKKKHGMIFFKDITDGFKQEEYVDILLGERDVNDSPHYVAAESDSFIKCMIEDCARDICEQSAILQLKSACIKEAYNIVVWATSLTLTTIVLTSVLLLLGI